MARGLQIAEPPRRKQEPSEPKALPQKPALKGEKFNHVSEHEKVQFNKRVERGVADGYEMLAIRTRRKVPELLAEALELLEEKYGKV